MANKNMNSMARLLTSRMQDAQIGPALTGGRGYRFVGYFSSKYTDEICLKHSSHMGIASLGQPMSTQDAKVEGLDPYRPDLWCWRCATSHAWLEHEYVIQRADKGGYEVIDTTFKNGSKSEHVFWSTSYEMCETWVNSPKQDKRVAIMDIK